MLYIPPVIQEVVERNYCVGCGLCVGVCPANCIEMVSSKDGGYAPKAIAICTNCEGCLRVCPFYVQENKLNVISEQLFGKDINCNPLLGCYSQCFVGHTVSDEIRMGAASGGLATIIMAYLMEMKEIDGCIIVKSSDKSDRYTDFNLATTAVDIFSSAGSYYGPNEISMTLKQALETDKKWAIVALPCLAYGLRLVQKNNKNAREKIRYIFSLTCGTMPNRYFSEYMVSKAGINNKDIASVNYRSKRGRTFAPVFFFEAYDKSKNALGRRLELTDWPLKLWTEGHFRTNACYYCDDVFGEVSDITFMDAWLPEYNKDVKGTSIIVVRNPELVKYIEEMKNHNMILVEPISPSKVVESQKGAIRKKRRTIGTRLYSMQKRNIAFPPHRNLPAKGTLGERFEWGIQKYLTPYSNLLWRQIGRRFGTNAYLLFVSPFLFLSFLLRVYNKIIRTIYK